MLSWIIIALIAICIGDKLLEGDGSGCGGTLLGIICSIVAFGMIIAIFIGLISML